MGKFHYNSALEVGQERAFSYTPEGLYMVTQWSILEKKKKKVGGGFFWVFYKQNQNEWSCSDHKTSLKTTSDSP